MKRVMSADKPQISPIDTLNESLDLLSDNIDYVLEGIELSSRNNPGSAAAASQIVADLSLEVEKAMQAVAKLINE